MQNWRNSREYRIWRVGVIRRDKRCKCCGIIKNRHAHHIKHATYWPQLRYIVENGIVLCSKCHSILHNKIVGSTRKKCWKKHLDSLMYISEYFLPMKKISKFPVYTYTRVKFKKSK